MPSYEAMIELLKNMGAPEKFADAVLVTSSWLLPRENAWIAVHEEKKYLMMHRYVFDQIAPQVKESGKSMMPRWFETTYVGEHVAGIPVIEDDELLKEIILEIGRRWQEQMDDQVKGMFGEHKNTSWPPKLERRDFGPSGS